MARRGAPYYAEAFSPLPGRCFRMVAHRGEAGPTWRAPSGRRYQIEACEGHRPTPIEDGGSAA